MTPALEKTLNRPTLPSLPTIAERAARAGATSGVSVTASFGAARMDLATAAVISTPGIPVPAADMALHAAKEGERNCVRVFKPRLTTAA